MNPDFATQTGHDKELIDFYEGAQIRYSPVQAAKERLQNFWKGKLFYAAMGALTVAGAVSIGKAVHNYQYNNWAEPFDAVHELTDTMDRHVDRLGAQVRDSLSGKVVHPALDVRVDAASLTPYINEVKDRLAEAHNSRAMAPINDLGELAQAGAYVSGDELHQKFEAISQATPEKGFGYGWFVGLGSMLSLVGLGGIAIGSRGDWRSEHKLEYTWRSEGLAQQLLHVQTHGNRDGVLDRAHEYLRGGNWGDAAWILALADRYNEGEHTMAHLSKAPSSEELRARRDGKIMFMLDVNNQRLNDGLETFNIIGFP